MSARLPASERRHQLLDVALAVFAEHGFHGTSMNQVAKAAAGVTKPVPAQHVRSTNALYRELLGDVSAGLEEAITKATAAAPGPRQQVEAGLHAYFRYVTDNRDAFTVLFGGGTRRDGEFAEAAHRVEDAIVEAIAPLFSVPGLSEGDRRLLAHGIVGLTEGTSRHWIANGYEPGPDVLADRVADLAWAGLRGVRSG
ncbi:MAG: TetR/AcrR family transcriptional regulator [Acidimicrobiales bacterium]